MNKKSRLYPSLGLALLASGLYSSPTAHEIRPYPEAQAPGPIRRRRSGTNCAGCNKPRLTPGERKRGVTLCPSCNRKVKVAEDE